MTRRIALAILATVALTLFVCGISIVLSVRSVLLRNLDSSLLHRAALLHHVVDENGILFEQAPLPDEGDRAIVHNQLKQTVDRQPESVPYPRPRVLSARFTTLADGTPMRTLTISAHAKSHTYDAIEPVTITYSGPTSEFDQLMRSIIFVTSASTLAGGVVAMLLARRMARQALAPLQRAADSVATIDIRTLDRRINSAELPSELKPMAGNINSMLDRIHGGVAKQRRFLDNAAHELRTPVASMLLTAELAQSRERDAAGYKDTFRSILGQARVLKRLVESLMGAARSETERPEEAEPIDVNRLLESVLQMMRPLAEQRNVSIAQANGGEILALVPPLMLRRAVTNLISNAIEHNPTGTHITLEAAIGKNGMIAIGVRDNGVGISAEHVLSIRDPFFRVNGNDNSGEHLGLGLAMVDSIATQLGGTLEIESTLDKGSTFILRFPSHIEQPEPGDLITTAAT